MGKSKIRDTKRALSRESLPAGAKVELERKLNVLTRQKDDKTVSQKEKKFTAKYKMVKFVEECKVKRKLVQLKKISPATLTITAEILAEEYKLKYIQHFPKDLKYVSLFPKGVENAIGLKWQASIMERIRHATDNGDIEKHGFILRKCDLLIKQQATQDDAGGLLEDEQAQMKDDFFMNG